MYVPPHFREDDRATLVGIMRAFPLATLVTHGAQGLVANHAPVLVDPDAGPNGTLHFHLARANPQWHDIAAGADVLAIFVGPEAYVSPSVYATKRETGRVVPTWNYVAVHAYGVGRTFDDPDALHALVSRLTKVHEADRASEPWDVGDAPAEFVAGQLRGIVGVEMPIALLAGKWKMSQNRSDADRMGVIADLCASSAPGDRAAGDLMATREERARPLH